MWMLIVDTILWRWRRCAECVFLLRVLPVPSKLCLHSTLYTVSAMCGRGGALPSTSSQPRLAISSVLLHLLHFTRLVRRRSENKDF